MTTPYVGEIRMFGFGRIPQGWLPCDGALQPISEYDVLYTLLGTTYGGDGVNTFATPDLRGQAPLHQGNGRSLTPRVIGQVGGSETVTLTTLQIPSHTHTLVATNATAEASKPDPTQTFGALPGDTQYLTNITGAVAYPLQSNAVGVAGLNQAHDNTMPTLTVSVCIAFAGIFPSQS